MDDPEELPVEEAAPLAETPRDEMHDSVDPHTGTLTAEAIALRAAEPHRETGKPAEATLTEGDAEEAKDPDHAEGW